MGARERETQRTGGEKFHIIVLFAVRRPDVEQEMSSERQACPLAVPVAAGLHAEIKEAMKKVVKRAQFNWTFIC